MVDTPPGMTYTLAAAQAIVAGLFFYNHRLPVQKKEESIEKEVDEVRPRKIRYEDYSYHPIDYKLAEVNFDHLRRKRAF
jgi:hypothetical protein